MKENEKREVLNVSQIMQNAPSLSELVGKVVYDDFKKDRAVMITSVSDRDDSVYIEWVGYTIRDGKYFEFMKDASICQLRGLPENFMSPVVDADPRNHPFLSLMSFLKRIENKSGRVA